VAEDVAAGPAAPPAAERKAAERPGGTRAERAHSSAYYTRFSFAFMLLIFVGVGAVGALVLVLIHAEGGRSPAWSKFKPQGSPIAKERQIATLVSSEYKASTSERLVAVFPGALETTQFFQSDSGPTSVQVPISQIAVQPDVSTGKHEEGDFTFFDPGSTIAYEMCGVGGSQQNCGVASLTGTNPSGLLHREALELALYTLKYVSGTSAVIVYLPPPTKQGVAATAVLIGKKDVKRNLDRPLARTLKPQEILVGGGIPNGATVGALTASRVYSSNYQTLPGQNTALLLLTPVTSAK
jgi:hypothetical protein